MAPATRLLSRHNSIIKAQTSVTNTSGQSIKANTSAQIAGQQNTIAQYISTVSKKVSNSIQLQQHLSRKHSHISPSSPHLPKSIKKQLVGTLSCMRPQSTSHMNNLENKGFMCYPKPPPESQKSSNAFYENMKSYIKEHMEQPNSQNFQSTSSYSRTIIENSRDVQTACQSVNSGLGFNVKTNSFYKPFRPLQPIQMPIQGRKDDGGDRSWNEQQNLKMRQALLKNLVEIGNVQAAKVTEKKNAETILMENVNNYLQARPESEGKLTMKRYLFHIFMFVN